MATPGGGSKRPRDLPPAPLLEASKWKTTTCIDVEPGTLVGSQIRIWWDGDNKFYTGSVVRFDPSSWQHLVHYEDGEQRQELLAMEKVQLPCVSPHGGPRPAPSAQQLISLGELLFRKAEAEAASKAAAQGRARGRAGSSSTVKRLEQCALLAMSMALDLHQAQQTDTAATGLVDASRPRQAEQPAHTRGTSGHQASPARADRAQRRGSKQQQGSKQQACGQGAIGGLPGFVPCAQTGKRPALSIAKSAASAAADIDLHTSPPPKRQAQALAVNRNGSAWGRPIVRAEAAGPAPDAQTASQLPGSSSRGDARGSIGCLPTLHATEPSTQQLLPSSAKVLTADCGTQQPAHAQEQPLAQAHFQQGQSSAVPATTTSSAIVPPPVQPPALVAPAVLAEAAALPGIAGLEVVEHAAPVVRGTDPHAPIATLVPAPVAPSSIAPADAALAAKLLPSVTTTKASTSNAGVAKAPATIPQASASIAAGVSAPATSLAPHTDDTATHRTGIPEGVPHRHGNTGRARERAGAAQKPESCATQYTELDVALTMAPESLLGLPIRVYWPLDRQFYSGKAVTYNPQSCKHKILYSDGDSEERVLAVDRVQVGVTAKQGQQLSQGLWPRPSAQQLQGLAAAVTGVADELQAEGGNRRQVESVRQRAATIEAAAATAAADEAARQGQEEQQEEQQDDGDDCDSTRKDPAHQFQQLPCWPTGPTGPGSQHVLQQNEAEDLCASLQGAYGEFQQAKGQYAQFRELDLAYILSPQALVGRQVRVYWPDEDAWFLGQVTEHVEATGQHMVSYADGDKEVLYLAVEAVRLLVHAGEDVPHASSSVLRAAAQTMQREGVRLLGQGRGDGGPEQKDSMVAHGGHEDVALGTRLLKKAAEVQAQAEVRQRQEERLAAAAEQQGRGCTQGEGTTVQAAPWFPNQPQQQQHLGQASCAMDTNDDGQGSQRCSAPDAAATAAAACEQNVPTPAAAEETAARQQQEANQSIRPVVMHPGDPVWAYVKGHTPWPCILTTPEEAVRLGVDGISTVASGRARQQRCVVFFGDYTAAAVSASCVLPFNLGLQRGLHNPRMSGHRRVARFRTALLEVLSYLKEGDLPRPMVPEHNDDAFACDSNGGSDADSDGEEGARNMAAAPGKQKHGRSCGAGTKAPQQASEVVFPLKLSKTLTLLALGRVEYVNPNFHTERHIYPIGYKVARLCSTPASGKEEAEHVLEVQVSADGLQPVFRVTPQGRAAVEGATPTLAFTALWDSDPASRAKSLQRTGPEAFGFSHKQIGALIRSLPGTDRCDKYRGWPGPAPPAAPLNPEEQLARTAVLASLQHLPSGIVPQPCCTSVAWECDVCGEDTEQEGSYLLHCDGCKLCVHQDCIGEARPPDGSLWLCDMCTLRRAGLRGAGPPCALCPVQGGPMKRTTNGQWCHLQCAMWVPEVGFQDPERREPIECIDKVTVARKRLLCCLCRQPYGAPIQCAGGRSCFTAFHALCARNAGMAMVMEVMEGGGSDSDNDGVAEERDSKGAQARQQASSQQETGQGNQASAPCAGTVDVTTAQPSSSCQDVNQGQKDTSAGDASMLLVGASPAGSGDGTEVVAQVTLTGQAHPKSQMVRSQLEPQQLAALQAAKRKGRKGHKHGAAAWEEGTRAGSHRLLCFCQKHAGLAASGPDRRRIYRGLQEEQRLAGAGTAAAADQGAEASASQARPLPGKHATAGVQAAAAGFSASERAGRASGSASQLPQRQGQGKGQGTTGASGRSLPGIGEHPYGSARCIPLASRRSRGPREPDSLSLAEAKRLYVQRTPYLVTSCLRQTPVLLARQGSQLAVTGEYLGARVPLLAATGVPDLAKLGPSSGAESAACCEPALLSGQQQAGNASQSAQQQADDPGRSQPSLTDFGAVCSSLPRSMAQRFQDMKVTLRLRLTCGKSAIHGLGAIAKVGHKAGDLVIEYAGELIRPSVADVRERLLYNQLVGSGTYVFRLSDDVCVDATRAGNMAHLLNHSCNPNCVSRTITVRNQHGDLEDHVVICAKRDLAPGEELTYDYRFNGEEKLPCNCGAAACRGFVNIATEDQGDCLLLPRSVFGLQA